MFALSRSAGCLLGVGTNQGRSPANGGWTCGSPAKPEGRLQHLRVPLSTACHWDAAAGPSRTCRSAARPRPAPSGPPRQLQVLDSRNSGAFGGWFNGTGLPASVVEPAGAAAGNHRDDRDHCNETRHGCHGRG